MGKLKTGKISLFTFIRIYINAFQNAIIKSAFKKDRIVHWV